MSTRRKMQKEVAGCQTLIGHGIIVTRRRFTATAGCFAAALVKRSHSCGGAGIVTALHFVALVSVLTVERTHVWEQ